MFSLDLYDAARRGAVFVDRSTLGKIVLEGADRLSFLHALLTNDIARLTKGAGCYSAYLTPQGRMISDMRVFELGTRTLLGVEALVADALAERLDKLIFSEDVQIRNLTRELAQVTVLGPEALPSVGRATGIDLEQLDAPYDNRSNGRTIVARDDSWGVRGYHIYLPFDDVADVRRALSGAGATEGDEDTMEVLRVESGTPRFGTDMDADTIPLEAGIEDRAISLTKGCYVGQEVIVRVLHRGHGRVARRLVGLRPDDTIVPRRGEAIAKDGSRIGEITSAASSPSVGGPIALGYVQRAFVEPGTEVSIGESRARVHALPFVRSG